MYKLLIVLDGKEFEVEIEGGGCSKEEATDFVETMRKTDGAEYISTKQGILSWKNSNVTSVYYLAVKI